MGNNGRVRVRGILLAIAVALAGCAREPPAFPDRPPSQAGYYSVEGQSKPAPAPPPHGVAVTVFPETHGAIAGVLAFGAVAFLLVILISLPKATRNALVPAGIAAALAGPLAALFVCSRELPAMFAVRPFDFAEFALRLWNANLPVLSGLYGATAAMLILLVIIAAVDPGEFSGSSAVPKILLLLSAAGAATAFLAFVSMNRLILGVVDPVGGDAIAQSVRSLGIAGTSRAIASRLLVTTTASLGAGALILVTVAISLLMRRRVRGQVLVVLVALIVTASATVAEQSWSGLLAEAARSGRVAGHQAR